jgi:cell division protein FtsB
MTDGDLKFRRSESGLSVVLKIYTTYGMDSERLKRIASGCLVLIVCFFGFLGLDNWFGSGPAIREVKQSISSVDSKQFKNASYNDSRIEKLEREVKDLQDEVESLKEKQR